MFQDGLLYSFGVLLPLIGKEFDVGKKEASLIHTLMTLATLGSGPVVAEATKRFGHRAVSVAGALLAMAGLTAAGFYISFAAEPAIAVLYLCMGGFTGIGFGMMYLPAMDIVEHWFTSQLGFANGIAAAGSGLGQFVIAPLLQFIQQKLSLTHTFFCLVGLVPIALPFVFIYRKPSGQEEEEEEEEEEELTYLELLRRPAALALLASYFLLDLGISSVPVFTTDRAEAGGLTGPTASLLLSTMGATNCLSRVLWGLVMDR